MHENLVDVVLPVALRHPLTYRVPDDLGERARPGCRVKVPLGKRHAIGCILGEPSKSRTHLKLRTVEGVLDDEPLLGPSQLKLLSWASAYYLTPIGEVLRHLVPPSLWTLRKREVKARKGPASHHAFSPSALPPLNREQEAALAAVTRGLDAPSPPILLHGITGSGKTEVYLRAAARSLEAGGQALILVPEIGLTPQLLGRFRALGDEKVVVAYHSALTPAQRYEVWRGTREGRHRVVIATRSGVFLPMPRLKLIVVDEEHDGSYKQEERFCYHARDLALWRASEEGIQAVLGSATPSLESLQRAAQGRMTVIRLSERPAGANLPEIRVIDRRREGGTSLFSAELLTALEATLERREQALLFVNRRGFAPFVLCPACGHVPECDRCDISLTLHKGTGGATAPRLQCHYCEYSRPYAPLCPACGRDALIHRGFGTERVAQEIRKLFPSARVARLDRDSVSGSSSGEGWMDILDRMRRQEIDVLVGTQMITKGHDYPHLTLVGILDADAGLHLPDFRAGERTYQILTQVAGRAGRAARPGRVFIQTYRPDHESLVAAVSHDGLAFTKTELGHRFEAGYPPFSRLVEVRFAGVKLESVRKSAEALARKISPRLSASEALLGPAPCPVERVRGSARWRLLVKTPQYARLQPKLAAVLDDFAGNDLPSSVRMLVNVDPVDMA
jgi:primosomal protein N' (replication factor Y)